MEIMRRDGGTAEARPHWPILPWICAALFAVLVSGADIQSAYGKTPEDILQAAGTLIASLGCMTRMAAAGWPDARAERTGPFSVLRDPMLAGGLMIALGLSLATQVLWFVVLVAGWATLRLLSARRKATIADTALPALLPNLAAWKTPSAPFSWKNALLQEADTLYVAVTVTVVLEISVDLRTGHATPQAWPSDWTFYFTAFALASFICLLAPRLAAENAKRHPSPDAATRGLLVEGRASIVDTLENLISAGRQEAILKATVDAAAIVLGDRLLDVGCGTGKLAIAAARRTGPQGFVVGIDATPAMIDLAHERARRENSVAEFRVGVAERLPFADEEFQAVTSSYFFHHLPSDVKAEALAEMWRVLAPGGRLIVTDYGRPQSPVGYIASAPMRFDFHEYVRPQLRGELEDIIASAGIGEPVLVASFLGYINVLRIVKP